MSFSSKICVYVVSSVNSKPCLPSRKADNAKQKLHTRREGQKVDLIYNLARHLCQCWTTLTVIFFSLHLVRISLAVTLCKWCNYPLPLMLQQFSERQWSPRLLLLFLNNFPRWGEHWTEASCLCRTGWPTVRMKPGPSERKKQSHLLRSVPWVQPKTPFQQGDRDSQTLPWGTTSFPSPCDNPLGSLPERLLGKTKHYFIFKELKYSACLWPLSASTFL